MILICSLVLKKKPKQTHTSSLNIVHEHFSQKIFSHMHDYHNVFLIIYYIFKILFKVIFQCPNFLIHMDSFNNLTVLYIIYVLQFIYFYYFLESGAPGIAEMTYVWCVLYEADKDSTKM